MIRLSSARTAMAVVAVLGWLVIASGLAAVGYGLFSGQPFEWFAVSVAVAFAGYLQVAASEIGVAIILAAESSAEVAHMMRHAASMDGKRQP